MAKNRPKKKHPSPSSRKSSQKELNAWDRAMLWLRDNEKLLLTGLLVLLAPTFAFVGPISGYFRSGGGPIVDRIYGEDITENEFHMLGRKLRVVDALLADPRFGVPERLLKGSMLLGDRDINVSQFMIYRRQAEKLGVHVSDAELTERIKECWRQTKSFEDAIRELRQNQPDSAASPYLGFQAGTLAQEKAKELEAAGIFDSNDWARRIVRLGRRVGITVRPRDVEDTMRDMLAVQKLEEYLASNVHVTPEEVYEHYRKTDQKRDFSWAEVRPSDELLASLEATAGDDEALSEYFETRISAARESRGQTYNPFDREFALRASYLLVPQDHFRDLAEKSVTQEELETYYRDHRQEFRRPVIRRDETAFALRSAEEMAELEAALFKPLADVEDAVREKVVAQKTMRELTVFVSQLKNDLFPRDEGTTAKTPTEIAEEHSFVRLGQTDWATRETAEDVFGDAYVETVVTGWFTQAAAEPQGSRVKIDPPQIHSTLPDDRGRIFYTKIETRASGIPRFKDVKDEVRRVFALDSALRLIDKKLEEAADVLAKDGAVDLATFASDPLVVTLEAPDGGEDGKEIELTVNDVERTDESVGRVERGGTILVAKEEELEADDDEAEATEDDSEPEKVAHESSRELLNAGFSLEKPGEYAVASSDKVGASYLVRFDQVYYPDSGEAFDKRREAVRKDLLRERREQYVDDWKNEVFDEAYPERRRQDAEAPVEEVAKSE